MAEHAPDPLSPLASAWKPGTHGNPVDGAPGVTLTELRLGSICEVRAWRGRDETLRNAIRTALGLDLAAGPGAGAHADGRSAFGIGPGRHLVSDRAENLATVLEGAVLAETGTITDLSHGRVAFRIEGSEAERVLSKLFAIDVALAAFPVQAGRATAHHDILAQIQRVGDDAFDLYVFRSFARSFWIVLANAAEDVGYDVR